MQRRIRYKSKMTTADWPVPTARDFTWCGREWSTGMEGTRLIHPDFPVYWYDPFCISMEQGGAIALTMRKNPVTIKHWNGVTYAPDYGTGVAYSKEAFGYGTFECDCILPLCSDAWPAFWLTGDDSWPPEIDIFEGYTEKDMEYESGCKTRLETCVHYLDGGKPAHIKPKAQCRMLTPSTEKLTTDWIHFKCIWTPDRIEIYHGSRRVRLIKRRWLFHKEQNTILDSFKGKRMHVVFDMWPNHAKVYGDTVYDPVFPFKVKNFKFTPYV